MRVEVSLDGFVLRVRVLLLKARTPQHKERLGSIFIRITHLFRFLYQSPGLRSWERPVSTTSQAYDRMTSGPRRPAGRNSLASRLCFCLGYTYWRSLLHESHVPRMGGRHVNDGLADSIRSQQVALTPWDSCSECILRRSIDGLARLLRTRRDAEDAEVMPVIGLGGGGTGRSMTEPG